MIIANLALGMKKLLVAGSVIGVTSMHRELLLYDRLFAIPAAEAIGVPILVDT
jgi:hypothetical protein